MKPNSEAQAVAEDRERVGATIREFREMRGLKPDECASLIPISRSHLANIEAGRRPVTRVLVARIAEVLNVRQAAIVPAGYFADVNERVSA